MSAILVTGGAGFIGSNFLNLALESNRNTKFINLDSLTYAGDKTRVYVEPSNQSRYEFVQGSICDRKLVTTLFSKYDITGVIHFAAESHVDNSIKNPEAFIETNVKGTYILLDVARDFWLDEPFKVKKAHHNSRFLHVSTDEVYGSLDTQEGYFTETSSYAPNSPYSASKASSDMIVRSYYATFGLNTVITNCSNNYGPNQNDEKLIPTIIRNALAEQIIPIYGDGSNIRDWLYVKDHCEAILKVFEEGKLGETYLIGGNNEQNNLNIAHTICSNLDSLRPRKCGKPYSDLIEFVNDRPGHDWRYAIDASKIKQKLGWSPKYEFTEGIKKTINWYIKNQKI